jgi:hypothetical protein
VAAGTLVTRDVPDFALVTGNPAIFRSWRCFCGFLLNFRKFRARCPACRERFSLDSTGGAIRPLRAKRDIQRILRERFKA